ncbi:MAG: sulfatase [Candidatus Altiarchaeota archaeon]
MRRALILLSLFLFLLLISFSIEYVLNPSDVADIEYPLNPPVSADYVDSAKRMYQCSDCNVIIISIDALRADHLSTYGYSRKTSSFIDSIARKGVVFENAITPRPKTVVSLTSMLTGLYPYHSGVRGYGEKPVYLPSLLKENGFTTAAFVSNWALRPDESGFDRYFDVYDYDFTRSYYPRPWVYERDAGETNENVFRWLDENHDKRFFLWIHYMEPHGPYDPPEAFRGVFTHKTRRMIPRDLIPAYQDVNKSFVAGNMTDYRDYLDQYDNEIYYADVEVRNLFDKLDTLGITANSLVILTSDHGESLGQHKYYFEHGHEVYDDSARIPLILKFPDDKGVRPMRVAPIVSNMDVYPTILSILGMDSSHVPLMDGVDLLPLLASNQSSRREVFIERYNFGHFLRVAVRTDRYKLIRNANCKVFSSDVCKLPEYECYDLRRDPREINRSGCRNDTFDSLKKILDDYVWRSQEPMPNPPLVVEKELNEVDEKILRSLGYVD